MSRQQDLMFCKIAVANGMISEEQAKKCLALVNKREQESGRRPQIGAIFSKYNILRRQDVQTIYEAVNRRMGGSGAPAGGLPAAPAGGKGRGRGGRGAEPRAGRRSFPGAEERAPRKKRVDPQTLWMGIVFGVVFLGIVLFLIVKFFVGPDQPVTTDQEKDIASSDSDSTSTGSTSAAGASGSGDGDAGGVGGGDTPAPPPAQFDPERRRKITQFLADTRLTALTDVDGALGRMKALREEVKTKNIALPPELAAEIDRVESELKAQADGSDAADVGDDDDDGGIDEDI